MTIGTKKLLQWDKDGAFSTIPGIYDMSDFRYLTDNQYRFGPHGRIDIGSNPFGYVVNYPTVVPILGTTPLVTNTGTKLKLVPSIAQQTVVATGNHIINGYIDENDKMWTWGTSNATGALLRSTAGAPATTPSVCPDTWKTASFNNISSSVSPTSTSSLGVKTDGSLWCGGNQTNGQFGINSTASHPVTRVGTDNDWEQVFLSSANAWATKTDGSLWTAGSNANNMTAQGTTTGNTLVWTRIGTANDWLGMKLVCTSNAVVTLKTDGTLWSWGSNAGSAIPGQGAATSVTTPTQIGTSNNWEDFEIVGTTNVYATDKDGSFWGWGSAAGIHNQESLSTSPVKIYDGASSGFSLKKLCSPGLYSCWATTTDGGLFFYSPFTISSAASHIGVTTGYLYHNVPPGIKMARPQWMLTTFYW